LHRDGSLLDRAPLARDRAAEPSRGLVARGQDLDPQFVVTFAALAVCHSDEKIHCGLTVVPTGRAPETIAASDDRPVRVDWLQRELAQGPAVSSNPGEVIVSKDLAADQRWPDFGRLCTSVLDLRSMVSIRVPMTSSDRARLTFYAAEPTALDHLDVDAALKLARSAAPVTGKLLGQFREALLTAATTDFSRIAIAVGIVISRYRLTSSEAFDMLLQTAQHLDRPLLGVALDVVERGRLPRVATSRTGKSHRIHRAPVVADIGNRGIRTGGHRAPSVGGPDLWGVPGPPLNAPVGGVGDNLPDQG
jgi:hypothetical protein